MVMMLLCSGYLYDISQWTNATKTIMHLWTKKQRYVNDEYVGSYKLLVQLGENKMEIGGDEKNTSIKMSTNDHPDVNYQLLEHAAHLLSETVESITKKCKTGSFYITNGRIISITKKEGIHIDMINLPDINYNTWGMTFEKKGVGINQLEYMVLLDELKHPIMSIRNGLFSTNYKPKQGEFGEMIFFGLNMEKISRILPFNSHFSYDNINQDVMCSLLDDTEVERPKLNKITKTKLNQLIGSEWEITTSIISDEDEKYTNESSDDDLADIFGSLISEDVIANLEINDSMMDFGSQDIYFDPSLTMELVESLQEIRIKYEPALIWERLENMKYNLIARSAINIELVSKNNIVRIWQETRSKGLFRSLVHIYDKIAPYRSESPNKIAIINGTFYEKFVGPLQMEYIDG